MRHCKKIIPLLMAAILLAAGFAPAKAEAKTIKKAGGYYTGLCTQDDPEDQFDSYAKKLVFNKKSFTVYGTTHYTKPGDVYSSKIFKKGKRTYKLSNTCKFYKEIYSFTDNGDVKVKKKKVTKAKIKKLALPLKKGASMSKMLVWEIKNGKVTKLTYRYMPF